MAIGVKMKQSSIIALCVWKNYWIINQISPFTKPNSLKLDKSSGSQAELKCETPTGLYTGLTQLDIKFFSFIKNERVFKQVLAMTSLLIFIK